MSLINISGTITQSHATASDVSSVTTLQQLSNVNLVNGLSENQLLHYNSTSQDWENNSLTDIMSNNDFELLELSYLPMKGFRIVGDGDSVAIELKEWGPGLFGSNTCGVAAHVDGGSESSPAPIAADTRFGGFFASGSVDYSGTIPASSAGSVYFKTTEEHSASSRGTEVGIDTCAENESSRMLTARFYSNKFGVNPDNADGSDEAYIYGPETIYFEVDDGSNNYNPLTIAPDEARINGSAYINNSGDIESSHSAWGGAAVKAASGIGGTPFYALRATTNTSWEPAAWGTGLYELKFDADLTGVNLDGTSQTVAFNFGDSNAAYSAAGLRATIRDPVITSGDIDTFDGTMSIFVSNHTSGGEDVYAPIELGSAKTSLVTVPDSAASSAWQNLHHIIMRDDPSSVANWHASAYTAQTPTDQQDLASIQVVTTAATLDSNNDYTDFNNDYEIWVTDLVAGSLSWYNPITASPDETLINPKLIITKDESDSSKAVAAMFNIKRKYDFDLTGHDINGDLIQAQQRLIDQSDASYPVSRQQSRINGVSIDGNGDIDDFEGSYRIQVTDVASKSMTHTSVVEFKSSAIESLVPVTSVNMDTTARNNLTAAAGMTIFNTTTSKLETYDGSAWQAHW